MDKIESLKYSLRFSLENSTKTLTYEHAIKEGKTKLYESKGKNQFYVGIFFFFFFEKDAKKIYSKHRKLFSVNDMDNKKYTTQ